MVRKKIKRGKNKVNLKNTILIFLSISLLFSLSSAEQGLAFQIDASLNGDSVSFYMATREGASSGYNLIDGLHPNKELAMPYLFSQVDGRELLVDVWDAIQDPRRNMNLRFEMTSGGNFTGQLRLSWNQSKLQDFGGRYFFILRDYGNDSTRTNLLAEINSNQQSSYLVSNNNPNRYFRIEVSYSYCGDGFLDSWENCEGTDFRGITCMGSGGTGFLRCINCRIDAENCPLCGNLIVNGEVGEECDGRDLNRTTCISLGYVSGTLSCVSPGLVHECRLDRSGCMARDGSPGPSPGGAGGRGGGGAGGGGGLCQDECRFGERRCIENSSYKICGNFDLDSCSEWGAAERCLGVNPFCNQGFCFGCLDDSDCKEGLCLNGRCESDCEKNCSDLGIQCGKRMRCGQILDCGSCSDGLFCNEGMCSTIPERAKKINDCSPNYLCSPWSDCKVSFDSQELLNGTSWFFGKKDRLCFDQNKCYSTIKEEEDCSLEIDITAKRREVCGINYLEIYDKRTDKLLARTRDSRYGVRRAIEIFLLPSQIDCEEEQSFELSLLDRFLFLLDFRKVWRLFI